MDAEAPRPATLVDDVVIFPNGEWRTLTKSERRAVQRGETLVLPIPPRFPWREIIYEVAA